MALEKESEPRAKAIQTAEDSEVARIAGSEIFRTAPGMRKLLLYLWEHRTEPVSEYAIAVDALGRRPDFDPKIDATVRVQIARLRQKLKECYETEPESRDLRFTIPLGGHQLEWIYTPRPDSVTVRTSTHADGPPSKMLLALAGVTVLLTSLCLFLLVQNRNLRSSAIVSLTPLPRFWESFLGGGRPTTIVLPTPLHFAWQEQNLSVRDSSVADYSDWPKSPVLLGFAKRWGPPKLDQSFVVVNHMLAAVRLQQYLERHGRSVQVMGAQHLAIDSSRHQNTILLGGPKNTSRFQALHLGRNFEIVRTNPTLIRNLHPKPGEPVEYVESSLSDRRLTFPGIIAVLRRSQGETSSLLVIGKYPIALASMLSSSEGLKILDEQWNRAGHPKAWEMVVQAEMHDDTVLGLRPVGFHVIP